MRLKNLFQSVGIWEQPLYLKKKHVQPKFSHKISKFCTQRKRKIWTIISCLNSSLKLNDVEKFIARMKSFQQSLNIIILIYRFNFRFIVRQSRQYFKLSDNLILGDPYQKEILKFSLFLLYINIILSKTFPTMTHSRSHFKVAIFITFWYLLRLSLIFSPRIKMQSPHPTAQGTTAFHYYGTSLNCQTMINR